MITNNQWTDVLPNAAYLYREDGSLIAAARVTVEALTIDTKLKGPSPFGIIGDVEALTAKVSFSFITAKVEADLSHADIYYRDDGGIHFCGQIEYYEITGKHCFPNINKDLSQAHMVFFDTE